MYTYYADKKRTKLPKYLEKTVIEDYGYTQSKAAMKLGLSRAAVSRYISDKRGMMELSDEKIINLIKKAMNKIVEGNDITIQKEICKICNQIDSCEILQNQ